MLVHDFLFNPVEMTEEMKPEVFYKYIDICNKRKGEQTEAKLVRRIGNIFYDTHSGVNMLNLDEIWATVSPKIRNNPGLAQFVLDYGGAESDYFFPWLIAVWTSPSEALEMAYGAGKNLKGEWVAKVPEGDKISYFVHNVPTFVYNRERQLKVADLVLTAQGRTTETRHYGYMDQWQLQKNHRRVVCQAQIKVNHQAKIVDFGAGRMAWARWHGFKPISWDYKIYAFDKDSNINPEDLFSDPSSLSGVRYKHSDFLNELENPELKDADLIILGGVASYIPIGMFAKLVVEAIYNLLKPGGSFFFDLQLNCPQYEWSVKLFNWPPIKLMSSAAEAIDTVEAIRKDFWNFGMRMSAEYALDTYSAVASSVMVTLTKL